MKLTKLWMTALGPFAVGLATASAEARDLSHFAGRVLRETPSSLLGGGNPSLTLLAYDREARTLHYRPSNPFPYEFMAEEGERIASQIPSLLASWSYSNNLRTGRLPWEKPGYESLDLTQVSLETARELGLIEGSDGPVEVERSAEQRGESLFLHLDLKGRGRTARIHLELTPEPAFKNIDVRLADVEDLYKGGAAGRQVEPASRTILANADAQWKRLGHAVFQISGPHRSRPERLEYRSRLGSGFGTAFLISNGGLMLTNHHVITRIQDCRNKLRCQVWLRQDQDDGTDVVYSSMARVLAIDPGMDFALIQFEDWDKFGGRTPLKIGSDHVGPFLASIGYPGSFASQTTASVEPPVRWSTVNRSAPVYANGLLLDFYHLGYATSILSSPGSSGGPVFNVSDQRVVGVVAQIFPYPGDSARSGSPTLVVPFAMIDHAFGIQGYVTGAKQSRIDAILFRLRASLFLTDASAALADYDRERSSYGFDKLVEMSAKHPRADVREAILNYFKKREWLQ